MKKKFNGWLFANHGFFGGGGGILGGMLATNWKNYASKISAI